MPNKAKHLKTIMPRTNVPDDLVISEASVFLRLKELAPSGFEIRNYYMDGNHFPRSFIILLNNVHETYSVDRAIRKWKKSLGFRTIFTIAEKTKESSKSDAAKYADSAWKKKAKRGDACKMGLI